jgi:hypothetical protein
MQDDPLKKYQTTSGQGKRRLPTIEDLDKAVEQPGEADPETLEYIKYRESLVEDLRRSRGRLKKDVRR